MSKTKTHKKIFLEDFPKHQSDSFVIYLSPISYRKSPLIEPTILPTLFLLNVLLWHHISFPLYSTSIFSVVSSKYFIKNESDISLYSNRTIWLFNPCQSIHPLNSPD